MKIHNTISGIYHALAKDLAMCATDFERGMVRAVVGPEIRRIAESLRRSGKLTEHEARIAAEFGFR